MNKRRQLMKRPMNGCEGCYVLFMKSKSTLMAVLAAGLLSLSLSSPAQATNSPPAAGRNARGRAGDQQLNQLSAQLNLTDDQKAKVKAVLQDQRKKAQELRANASSGSQKDLRAKRQAMLQDTNKKLQEILSPDQFKKYEELRQQQRGNRGAAGARPNRKGTSTNASSTPAGSGTTDAEAK
jgi:Spy/CpxP family protein refolding chaperone